MSSIDSIGGRFVFNGSHRTIPGLGAGIASLKMLPCLGWPILLLAIFRLVARAREEIANFPRKNLPRVVPRLRAPRTSSLSQCAFRTRLFCRPLFFLIFSISTFFIHFFIHFIMCVLYYDLLTNIIIIMTLIT